ncbi:MAG: phosphotransferase family protein [Oligoflexales bacterium]|nr:phosphotransferase family protein [Oligoflexales bacterium]
MINQATMVRPGEELPINALQDYIHQLFPDSKGDFKVLQYPAGHSNLTYLLNYGDKSWVLRRPPHGTKAKSAHDMSREYRMISAIKDAFPYCPRLHHICEDEGVIGAPFYLMSPIAGIIFRKDIPAEMNFNPEKMRRCCEQLIEVHAKLHSIPLSDPKIKSLGNPKGYGQRQVEGWSKRISQATTPNAPDWSIIANWLKENLPQSHQRASVIHNDYKFDNVVWDLENQSKIVGILDWEMATLGDPLMDLGNSLAYWIEATDPPALQGMRMLPTNAPGAFSRKELLELYREKTSFEWDDFNSYYVFGLSRLAGIVQQIYYRFHQGQTKDKRFAGFIHVVHALEKTASSAIERPQF